MLFITTITYVSAYSILPNTHGLGVDRDLPSRVVTPDGPLRLANAYLNTNLFYALCGDGGRTCGFVMEAATQILPQRAPTVVRPPHLFSRSY